jgi:O-antigen biosynthesis protein
MALPLLLSPRAWVVRLKKSAGIIKDDGLLALMIAVLTKVQSRVRKKSNRHKIKLGFLADYQDIISAQWATHPYQPTKRTASAPYTVNWVMSPPRSGGGHQNMFRFIEYLERQGHTCNIYLYSTGDFADITDLQTNLAKSYPPTKAADGMQWLDGPMAEADAVFATGWETAYPVFNEQTKARKFYFVQDFEPYFYPLGSEYVLAENTYKFNFYGITAGKWLSNKLSQDYSMKCDYYEFGADPELYQLTNTGPRKEILFYARPVTTRRGFELGIMALQIFHEKMPDYTITLAGWDVSTYAIPFPYKNLKTLSLKQLSAVYNQCAAGLVVSLTNMSLMPLELLASGTIPVVTDGPNNRQVSDNPFIAYAQASPDALAQALIETVTRKDLPNYAKKAAQSVQQAGWQAAKDKFIGIMERELHG